MVSGPVHRQSPYKHISVQMESRRLVVSRIRVSWQVNIPSRKDVVPTMRPVRRPIVKDTSDGYCSLSRRKNDPMESRVDRVDVVGASVWLEG